MNYILRPAVFIIAVFALATGAFAQSTNSPAGTSGTNSVKVLPETVVVGKPEPESFTSPSAETAAEQNKEIPGGYNVKTTAEMNRGRASNFQDLLQNTPGLFIQSENGMEMSKVSIRGSGIESDDEPLGVEFLLDGISFDQGDGETIIEDFDVDTLKYAEVYRGANALKFGVLTIGGAINLVPLTGYDADPFQIRAEGGSYGFMRGQISSAGVDGKFDYYASLSARYRDGFRDHSRENTEVLFSDIGYKFNDNLENRFYLTTDQTDRQLPGGLTQDQMYQDPKQADPDAVPFDFNKQWEYVRLADKLSYVNGGQQLDASVYWWHRELEEKDVFDPDDFEQGIEDYHADDGGISLDSITHSQLFGQANILTIGTSPAFETEQDHFFANLGYLDPPENGQKGDTIGKDLELSVNVPFYAENQHYLTEKLSLITGVQAMYVVRHFYDYFNDTLDGDQSTKQDFYSVNPKAGLLYELNDNNQIFANVSRAWQPPSFDNMVAFDDGPGVSLVYTPLDPQHAITGEIGMRGDYGAVSWDVAYYYSWVRNELLDLFNPATDVDRGDVNVNKTYHEGVEAGLNLELWNSKKTADPTGQRITLNQTYTLNDFHFVNDPVYGDDRIGGIPIHVYEAQLMYESPCGFYAGPNIQANLTKYPVDQENQFYANAYWLLGFKIGYANQWKKLKYQVFVEAKNLNNEIYAASVDPFPGEDPGDPAPQVYHPGDRRSFYGGLTVSW